MISTRQIKLVQRKTEKATNGSGGKANRAHLQAETDRCSHRWGGANSRSTRRDGTDNSEGRPDSRRAAKYLKHCGWSWNDGPEVWPAEGGLPRDGFFYVTLEGHLPGVVRLPLRSQRAGGRRAWWGPRGMRPEWPLGAMAGGPGHTPRPPRDRLRGLHWRSLWKSGSSSWPRGRPRRAPAEDAAGARSLATPRYARH